MDIQKSQNDIRVLTKQDFFMSDTNFHIQMSNEFPDYIGIVHKHKFIEVVYIISGTAVHEIQGKTYPAKRGDLFIINMGTSHAFHCQPELSEPFVAYDLKFTPEFFDQSVTGYHALEDLSSSFMFYSLFHEQEDFSPYLSVSGSSYTMFGELFNKIYLEHRAQEKGYIEIIRAYLVELIITIFRIVEASANNAGASQKKHLISYVNDYINKNYSRHISIQELADKVYMNRDYLGRIFRESTGVTISTMIQKVRIERTCCLLSTTDRTVTDIAAACGFDDMKFFYKTFKKFMGILPGEYRKRTHTVVV